MANGFTPQMYSEGAVVFDSSPSIKLAEQITNRQLAKDEALDKYFGDLHKSFNPAGMRTQDTPYFMQKTDELRDFYAKNKDAIRNPKKDLSKAYNEYYSRYQDALNTVNQSKQEGEKIKAVQAILADPAKRSLVPESVLESLGKHELPINDPNRISFNPAMLNFNPKPFGDKEQQSMTKGLAEGIKMQEDVAVGPTDPKNLTQKITTTYSLSPEDKMTIHRRAASRYVGDPSFKQFIDTVATDDKQSAALNKVFRESYGADIETPEDVAAAWGLQNIQSQRQTEKVQADQLARQKLMEGIRFGHAKDLAYLRNSLSNATQEQQNDTVDELYEGLKSDAQKSPVPYSPAQGQPYTQYEMKAPGGVKGILAVTDASGKKIYPDAIRFSQDMKTVTPIFFERVLDSKGKRTDEIDKNANGGAAVIEEFSKPIKEQEFKLRWKKELLGVGGFNKSLKNSDKKEAASASKYTISGKRYSHDQVKKMGYSDAEINEAIKAGLIQQ